MNLQDRLQELVKKKNSSISAAAKAMGLSPATINLWVHGKYDGKVQKVDEIVANYLEIEELRDGKITLEFVRTSVVDDVFDIAKTCHVENEIGVCYGEAGLGKTFAVKRYAIENPGVVLIEADLGYTPKVLFSELHKKLGFDGIGTIHGMFLDVVDKLKSSGRLIIVDEAEHLPYKSLELLRRVYDKANVGILLVGMPRLILNLKGEKRQYAQLFSRVGISTKINPLTDEDQKTLICKVLQDYEPVFKTLSSYSAGNTRVLSKLLVRAVRIAELNNIAVNDDVIEASVSQIIV